MKHWLPPTAILVAILAFCLWDTSRMAQKTDLWCAHLQQADQLATTEDWDAALHILDTSYTDWCRQRLYVHIVSPRDAVDDAEAMYLRAIAFAKTEEITEFRAELSDLQNQIRILNDMESFKPRAIF